ncbi:unnamed protein product [Ostreobium quekettii]|uniref:Peptidase S1 domain-containing protein n=1 Tax=Ostreobium quekettii TaxID=121088 RepID=A0A8S1IN21_9CHLO|nr:unnamed protein product [Ostreobium quekettii]
MDEDLEVQTVKSTTIHKNWAHDKYQRSPFDIALLKLEHKCSHATPKLLSDHFTLTTGQALTAAGWGAGSQGPALGGPIFGSLKLERQEYICAKRCNASALWNGAVPDERLVCGLNDGRKSSCIVDSGCPLLLMDAPGYDVASGRPIFDFVVGINVDGAPCGQPARPDMYIDIREHSDWIRKNCGDRVEL